MFNVHAHYSIFIKYHQSVVYHFIQSSMDGLPLRFAFSYLFISIRKEMPVKLL